MASIFKGSFKIGKGSFLTKIFLGFQITMACILISLAVMFTQNSIYQSEREWGYDNTDVIYAELPDHTYFEQFYNAMNPHGNVETISGSIHHLAKKSVNTIVEEGINKYEVRQLEVDSNYFETMGLQLVAGRDFEGSFASDEKAIIINETLASSLSSVKPLGKWLTIDSAEFEIVGIVKDFHVYNFDYRIRPLIFRLAYQDNFKFIAIKAQEGKGHKIHEALRDTWATLLPELPFNGGYQEGSWGSYYESLASGGRFWRALAFMVLILSGLGLYGLVSLNASGRTKEFSVRKILGAKLENIAFCISKEYTVIFVISMMLGIPLSYFLVESLFKMFFTYHMPMNFAFTLFSGSILVLVLAGIFISQIRKVTKSSLTDGLKVE